MEIVSPTESAADMQAKVDDYLRLGSDEVWVLYPGQRKVHRYRRDQPGTVSIYDDTQTLEAEPLFPGLKLRVADLFVIEES